MPLQSPTPRHHRTAHAWMSRCSWLLLLALVLQVVYVPFHLATEDHIGARGHALSHLAPGGATAEHGHEGEHEPHPGLDHATDLVAQRAPSKCVRVELDAAPYGVALGPLLGLGTATASSAAEPPESRPRGAWGPRGPPPVV